MSDALAYAPIHTLAEHLRSGELTPSALLDVYLQRIHRFDEKLHAFAAAYESDARARAEIADRAFAAGHRLGPLHGIPIAYKDLLHIQGCVTRGGSLTRDISSTTAAVVERLTAAGMITLGKTHMVELAFGSWGTNTYSGTPWNPWDLATHRVPGGSSSGSGVAVAAALSPAAIGSDTGGSIRIPASLCGIVGLKTTVGRVSNHGAIMLSRTLDTLGPMTRDVEDAALLFDAMHGPDVRDAATLAHAPVNATDGLKRGIEGLRMAVFPLEALGELSPEVEHAFAQALEAMRSLGARIDTLTPPAGYAALADTTGKILATEGYEEHKARIESNDPLIDPDVRARMLSGKTIAAPEYIRIMLQRKQLVREMDVMLGDFDALLLPTTPSAAIPVGEVDQRIAPMSRLTRAVNLLDLCALAVPCGFTNAGLPLSLQIVGRGYTEAKVLRIGWAYENAMPRHERTPLLT
jgi:aspartyl-tRNA(Asn)/glutamyl-tRNA(Gln) amidotransferase subunit A